MDSRAVSKVGLRVIGEDKADMPFPVVAANTQDAAGSIFDRAMRHMVDTHRDSELVLRNVTVNGRRTTIRLEPEMWDALAEIARRENYTQTQLCSRIADGQPPGLSFTASVRMFILTYFRTAAHGSLSAAEFDETEIDRVLLTQ